MNMDLSLNKNNSLTYLRNLGRKLLKEKGKTNFAFEIDGFLMKILNCTKTDLLLMENKTLSIEEVETFNNFVQQRLNHKPYQYILGECEFMGLNFSVGEGVLIPRSDTEILVETILNYNKIEDFQIGIDICTGSGCIPISLNHYGKIDFLATDISEIALSYAKKNGQFHNSNIQWFLGDLFSSVPNKYENKVDFIVSNPPYITTFETKKLMEEVKDFEPNLALDGGESGLEFYEKITAQSKKWLRNNGWLFFEIGYDQGESVSKILRENGFNVEKVIKDYGGNDRVVFGSLIKN